jgi:hypothetical protein
VEECVACGQVCKAAELEGGYCPECLEEAARLEAEADRASWN